MLDPLYEAIGWLLSIFYSVIPNLGVAIILLTFTIMLLLYPLTAKQARSMIAMQMVQPEIKRIQAKYKNDRAKLNEELMKFYQENKINPLAGCLPLVVQLPIFFALFQVLRNSYKYVPDTSSLYRSFCTVPGSDRVLSVQQCGSDRFGDAVPVHQKFLGMDLSVSAPDQVATWATILAFTLVVLVMFTGYMQSRQAQKRTPTVNKQVGLIMRVLPVFFGFISLNFPSGLVLYFFVSNLWRLGQQEVIFRRYGTAANPKHHKLAAPKVVDAESRERTADVEDGADPETPATEAGPGPAARPAKGRPKGARAKTPAKPAGTTPAAGKPVVPGSAAGGGLRGLFRPPPPPTGSPAARAPSSGTSSGKAASARKASPTKKTSGTTSRPGEAGRRTSKKKKKR